MRVLLLCVALLFLSGCSGLPKQPEASPCASLAFCGENSVKRVAGLGANKSVMFMVQSPMLIGGRAADPSEWPASVYAKVGGGACSATLVGDRVLFIASHCIDDGQSVSFTAHANAYKARCAHHPEYKKNDTADWALCLVDRPVTGVPFEVFGPDVQLAVDSTLLLSGYGCIKPGGGGGNDGIFRIGNATVKGLPYGKTYDIVTKGGSALCFGDSGGAVFSVTDKARYIVGVNSRGDIATMSYLPAISAQSFLTWANAWAKASNNVRICGIHSDALGCRLSENPAPLVDGKFEVYGKAACVRGSVAPNYLDRKEEIVETLKRNLDQF